jgi:hypothetical protein
MAEQELRGRLGRLMAVVESHPELKAGATLRDLSEELGHTENRIAFACQAFNAGSGCTRTLHFACRLLDTRLPAALARRRPPLQWRIL